MVVFASVEEVVSAEADVVVVERKSGTEAVEPMVIFGAGVQLLQCHWWWKREQVVYRIQRTPTLVSVQAPSIPQRIPSIPTPRTPLRTPTSLLPPLSTLPR